MSFHVVHHEHSTIFVLNRRTYETYRFTVGDDLAVGRVDSQLKRDERPLRFWFKGKKKIRRTACP
jgi:hypothetical protein